VVTGIGSWTLVIFAAQRFGRPEDVSAGVMFLLAGVWGAILVKIALATVLARRQLRSGLLKANRLQRGALIYAGLVILSVTLVGIASQSFRNSWVSALSIRPILVDLIFLGLAIHLVPVVRVLAAAATLNASRHARY
jgi:hypothetical protein